MRAPKLASSSRRKTILLRALLSAHHRLKGSSPAHDIPDVEIIWKFCGKQRLTGYKPHCMVVKFRGQSEMLSGIFAWTEFAPPRRIAIRSLTTRLNVPVVRNHSGISLNDLTR